MRHADVILVLGSHDLRVAERSAELLMGGWAPILVMSGGLGNLTRGHWHEPEAKKFARVAIGMGVPPDRILTETESTNTGENLRFSRQLLQEARIPADSFILVQKPYMERRTFATFKKFWPGKELVVTSPPCTMTDYPNEILPLERVINIMVGDLQRIMVYPEMGFQIEQSVPEQVKIAYDELIRRGFDEHLIA